MRSECSWWGCLLGMHDGDICSCPNACLLPGKQLLTNHLFDCVPSHTCSCGHLF